MASTLGRMIADARKRLGWSQKDVAKALDVSQQTVANWERGGVPRGARWDELARVLKLSPTDAMILRNAQAHETSPSPTTLPPDSRTEENQMGLIKEPSYRIELRSPSEKGIQEALARIQEIHREHEAGMQAFQKDYPGSRIAAMSYSQDHLNGLRANRFDALIQSLHFLPHRGQLEGSLPHVLNGRRFDYLSDRLVVEIAPVVYRVDTRAMSIMRYSSPLLALALAKARLGMSAQAMLVLVVEVGDLTEWRYIGERFYGELAPLGILVRVVANYREAAEVISETERFAPIFGTLNITEEPDRMEAGGIVRPGPEHMAITGHAPEVRIELAPSDDASNDDVKD